MANISTNYFIGKKITETKQKSLLIIGIILNLGVLGYFKYTGFLLTEINALTSFNITVPKIILPLAISFYIFQQIAFLADSFKGKIKDVKFIDYVLFVSFFPQLIAGPIVHYRQVIEQFKNANFHKFNLDNFNIGITVFIIGLSKKCLIADNLAEYANPVFDAVQLGEAVTLLESWAASLTYTLQLYFDFSGYSDMAIGLGLLFNIKLPINFSAPLLATSIIEFWRKWHITLSQFLKDYLYIPLGGNRKGNMRRYINLFITMLLGGIWHGAGWTFLIWGGLHGLYLIANHAINSITKKTNYEFPVWLGWISTFLLVMFAFTIFRAESFSGAMSMYKGMLGLNAIIPSLGQLEELLPFLSAGPDIGPTRTLIIWTPIALLIMFFGKRSDQVIEYYHNNNNNSVTLTMPVVVGLLFIVSVIGIDKASEFLYFQF